MKILDYFFINNELKKTNNFIKTTILVNFPHSDIEKLKENINNNFERIERIYHHNDVKKFYLKLKSWPSQFTSFHDYLKMNISLNIINASLQYSFWYAPGIDSKFNSSRMQSLIQNASDIVLDKYNFLSLKKFEKLLIKQIKILLLNYNNIPWLKERFETLEYLEKYGVHLKNPVFLKDFYRKKQFFAIYLILNFINYLLKQKDYLENNDLIRIRNHLWNLLFPVIDYRIPQALYDLKIFNKIPILESIKRKILNYNLFLEGDKNEFLLRGYSYIAMNLLLNKFNDYQINYGFLPELDSVLFTYAKNYSNIPHHYCRTTNY